MSQNLLARDLVNVLAGRGLAAELGEYDLLTSAVVWCTDGSSVVVVPLSDSHDTDEPSAWSFLVRTTTGEWVNHPDTVDGWDAPFGCPSLWLVTDLRDNEDHDDVVVAFLDNYGFRPVRGVKAGTPVGVLAQQAFARPAPCVVDGHGEVFPLVVDRDARSGFSVADNWGAFMDLSDWADRFGLTTVGAA